MKRSADGDTGTDPWSTTGRLSSPEPTVALVLALATINFGSGWHPVIAKLPGMSGATSMATGLRRWVNDHGPLTTEMLLDLDRDTTSAIFGQSERDGPVGELMGHFTDALHELGSYVRARHQDRFGNLVAAANGRASSLVAELAGLSHFADFATHEGHRIPLLKRAQLAVADLHRAFAGRGPGRFADLDQLTAFADNLVPHVLRLDEVLTFDPDLVRRIDDGELIDAGSPEEVEIRAVGVHAVELLRDELRRQGVEVPSWQLDGILWRRGGRPRYKAVPRHRSRSLFY